MKRIDEVLKKSADKFAKSMIVKKYPQLAEKEFELRQLCRCCESCKRFSVQYFEVRIEGKKGWREVPLETKFCIPCENDKLAHDAMANHLADTSKRVAAQFWVIPPELENETLATYQPTDPEQAAAFAAAAKFLKDYKNGDFYNLIYRGSYGGGKSHLLKGIAEGLKKLTKKVVHNGVSYDIPVTVGFLDMESLLGMIKGTFGRKDGQSEHDIMRIVIEMDVLIIDDVGTESGEWAGKKIFEIINGRMGKTTLYSTNYMEMNGPGGLESRFPENGGKIVSRLRSNTKIVDLITVDMREEKQRG